MEKQGRSAHILAETHRREAYIGNLAVLGTEASLRAMVRGAADMLVLARTAQRHDVQIYIVTHSDERMDVGGVGRLLRYRQTYESFLEHR
jgi:hypothetical protein